MNTLNRTIDINIQPINVDAQVYDSSSRELQFVIGKCVDTGGGTTKYSELTDKPKINNIELVGNKTAAQLGLQTELTIDAMPTEDSTNPVQSGGVYEALATQMITTGALFGGFAHNNAVPSTDTRYYYLTEDGGDFPYFGITDLEDDGKWKCFYYENRWQPLYISAYSAEKIDKLLATKVNKVFPRDPDSIALLGYDGKLVDSRKKTTDFAAAADLAGKQDTISDLSAIRSGAAAGATAVQSSDLATVATSGSYNDLLNKPTIPDVSGKADKVNGATNGDFAGLDGNGNLVDTGYNEDDFSLKVVFLDVSTTPSSMLPNKVYRFGTLSGDTTFPAFTAVPSGDTEVKIWCWTFTTPSTAPTITWPAGITSWAGGSAPTINASKSYEVSVMDGFATIIEN